MLLIRKLKSLISEEIKAFDKSSEVFHGGQTIKQFETNENQNSTFGKLFTHINENVNTIGFE